MGYIEPWGDGDSSSSGLIWSGTDRDFVSGYIIAEIFIRYYPNAMSMNGFQNSVSMKAKENNWELLEKLMKVM